jgi:hypothetical protein
VSYSNLPGWPPNGITIQVANWLKPGEAILNHGPGPSIVHPRDYLHLRAELSNFNYAQRCAMHEWIRSSWRRGGRLVKWDDLMTMAHKIRWRP